MWRQRKYSTEKTERLRGHYSQWSECTESYPLHPLLSHQPTLLPFPTSSSFWCFHRLFCEHVQTMSSLASMTSTPNPLKCAAVPLMSYFLISPSQSLPWRSSTFESLFPVFSSVPSETNRTQLTEKHILSKSVFLISLPTFEGLWWLRNKRESHWQTNGSRRFRWAGSATLRHHSANWEERDGGVSEHYDARVVVVVGLEMLFADVLIFEVPASLTVASFERNVSFNIRWRRRGTD